MSFTWCCGTCAHYGMNNPETRARSEERGLHPNDVIMWPCHKPDDYVARLKRLNDGCPDWLLSEEVKELNKKKMARVDKHLALQEFVRLIYAHIRSKERANVERRRNRPKNRHGS